MNVVKGKVGRNEPCPCGRGKKYKHCCGSYIAEQNPSANAEDGRRVALQRAIAEHDAKEVRRRQQQGLGRPIISTEFAKHRIVAVGNTVHWSRQRGTFHDFLFDYIKQIFGNDWGIKEQEKSVPKRHILLRWAHQISEYQKTQKAKAPNVRILSAPATPILAAHLSLAYNLYLMKHNAKLQRVLIDRLKNPDESSFHGAYYETFVAATFIKAGYGIDFENEQDGSETHCEFTASRKGTDRKFSVEAKARFRGRLAADIDPKTLKLGIRDKIEAALRKKAKHKRVIFVDVNLPEIHSQNQRPFWVETAVTEARDLENTMIASGQETPAAYIIITNQPYQFAIPGGLSAVIEGFNVPELKLGAQFPNLRAALDARERHADIHHVFESMQQHRDIPSTFNGEMPEVHFAPSEESVPPLKVGQIYLVPGPDGAEFPAELENTVVMEGEKKAYGVYRRVDTEIRLIANCPLTDRELEAYRKYPTTFFGEVDENAGRKCQNIFDWYDFAFESYGKTPKQKLLEYMKDSSDIESLKMLPQEELAKIYCERLAYSVDRKKAGPG